MCKQLNGSVLKSLKSKWSGLKLEKKIGRAEPGPKFCIFFFRDGPGLGRNFNFPFGPGQARAEREISYRYFGPGWS